MSFLNFRFKCLMVTLLIIEMTSCRPKVRELKSPPHYDFSKVLTIKLSDPRFLEISGIAWDSKNNVFLAVTDESDKLFIIDRESMSAKEELKIGNKGDYEDVAILNGTVYILRSDGMVTKLVRDSTGKAYYLDIGSPPLSGPNDFETIYSDTSRKALVVICKNCKSDDENTVSAFAFYPDSIGYDTHPLFKIDAQKIRELSPVKTSKFQPSAAAIHPISHKLYILSSASKQLAITDLDGKVEAVYRLSPKLFPQPEGITFQSDGDMFISNEGYRNRNPNFIKNSYIIIPDSAQKQITRTGYDLSTPNEKMELGKQLHEISGMAYIAKKNVILCENDEKGDIFMVDFKNKNDNDGKVKFGGKGDYEDIVHTDTAEYMLVSTGSIVKVSTKDSLFNTEEYNLGTEKYEFESMYLDADKKTIILLCKECGGEKDKVRTAYRFDPATNSFATEPAYSIDISEIQKILNDDKAEFKPSAAGINPVTGKLFIVASVGKLLVVADKKGKVEEVYKLDPVLFNQPEGLTFAPNGDLYISNEGGEGIATILKFSIKKK
ncbi:MAG: SdiA-regulated domain-containing protein [Chitinophagaceae bacterium]